MIVRLSKALLVALVGSFALLVGIDNIIDYGTNFAFVHHVAIGQMEWSGSCISFHCMSRPCTDLPEPAGRRD